MRLIYFGCDLQVHWWWLQCRELVSSELEPMFRQLGVPDPVTAAAQVCAAHGEDKDTITLDEFLTATSTVGFKMK